MIRPPMAACGEKIMVLKVAAVALLFATMVPAMAYAEAQGTPKEQDACRPDVRKFCQAVKPGSGNGAFLSCLLARRANLSQACLTVLQDHNVL